MLEEDLHSGTGHYTTPMSNNKTNVKNMRKAEMPSPLIHNILVPTDFSENATKALQLAVGIAEKNNASVIIVHACHMPFTDEHMAPSMIQELMDATKLRAELQMTDYVKANKQKFNDVQVSAQVIIGFAAETILEVAHQKKVDIIIIGTQGVNGIEDRLFGTVTWNIIKRSDIPVIAIPETTSDLQFKNIMIPFEGTVYDTDIINYLLKFAEKYNAVVHGVHFIQDASTYNKGVIDKLQNKFRKEIDAEKLQLHFPAEKNITDGIKKFAARNQVDLISMVTHNHGLFSTIFHMSVTRNIALYAQIPLLAYNMDRIQFDTDNH